MHCEDAFKLLQLEIADSGLLTEADIKSAYRRRSLELHPDKGGDSESFRQLQEAYETLKDPVTRNAYSKAAAAGAPALWRELKEYEGRLRGRRMRQSMAGGRFRQFFEEFAIEEPFRSVSGVLPLHASYAEKAFATFAGVWVVYVGGPNHDRLPERAFAALAARAVRSKIRLASVNLAVADNEAWVRSTFGRASTPRIIVLAARPEGLPASVRRVVDWEHVDANPRSTLPVRVLRVAKVLETPVHRTDNATCAAEPSGRDDRRVTLLLAHPDPELMRALRRASLKYAPVLAVSWRLCADAAACAPGGLPRLVFAPQLRLDDIELADMEPEVPASRFSALLEGLFAAKRAEWFPPRAPQRLTLEGVAAFENCSSNDQLDGTFRLVSKTTSYGRGLWQNERGLMARWQPASLRTRAKGAWLLTDVLLLDRAWAFLEADLHVPFSNASAECWTFHCPGPDGDWNCQPHFKISA